MKRIAFLGLAVALLLLISLSFLPAQVDSTKTPFGVTVPAGFDPLYLAIFALGMIIHYAIVVKNKLGMANYFKNFLGNFLGWFANKWHLSAIGAAAGAILAFVAQYAITAQFSTLNSAASAIVIAVGYIGDSMFNQGNLIKQ